MAVESSPTTNPLPTGYAQATPIGTTSVPVLPPGPTRGGLIFINNGSVVLAICPATVVTLTLASGVLVSGGAAIGVAAVGGSGSINLNPGDKFIVDNLPATGGWNAVAAALVNGVAAGILTVLEF